jgi:hypothetical protein
MNVKVIIALINRLIDKISLIEVNEVDVLEIYLYHTGHIAYIDVGYRKVNVKETVIYSANQNMSRSAIRRYRTLNPGGTGISAAH